MDRRDDGDVSLGVRKPSLIVFLDDVASALTKLMCFRKAVIFVLQITS